MFGLLQLSTEADRPLQGGTVDAGVGLCLPKKIFCNSVVTTLVQTNDPIKLGLGETIY